MRILRLEHTQLQVLLKETLLKMDLLSKNLRVLLIKGICCVESIQKVIKKNLEVKK